MQNWLQTHPFVVLLLPLIAGILLCDNIGICFDIDKNTQADFLDSTGVFAAVIEDYPVEKAKTFRYTASTNAGTVYLYLRKDSAKVYPTIGDCIQFHSTIVKPDSIGSFDYGTYLRRQGIVGQAFVRSEDWQIIGHTKGGILMFARRLQHRLVQRYHELGIPEREAGTLSALTLGYREDLDPDIKRSFRQSGASHVLAVSGLHTGIIYTVILALLTGFGYWKPLYEDKKRRIVNGVIIIVIMVFYALLTGLSPSVFRSVLMLILVEVAYMCYRRPIGLNIIAAAAFLILVFRPNDLFSVSFQLSFAAVLSIIYFTPYFTRLMPIPRTKWFSKPLGYFCSLISASLAAQIGTLPITLYYFHQTCNYFIFTNILVIPLVFVITIMALATLTIGWIPAIGIILSYPLKWLTWVLNHYTAFIESLPGAYSVLPF